MVAVQLIKFIYHQEWVHVPGKLKWIASGKDIVVGVNAYDDIYFRDGISNRAPMGLNVKFL